MIEKTKTVEIADSLDYVPIKEPRQAPFRFSGWLRGRKSQPDIRVEKGNRHPAVEASFTADQRDTQRAIRNADLLQRLTGHNALAVVASVRNSMEAQENIDAGLLHWFQIDE